MEKIDKVNAFNDFCKKNHIVVLNEIDKLNQKTMVKFNCLSCCIPIRKSYKILNRYDKLEHYSFLCNKCFMQSFH